MPSERGDHGGKQETVGRGSVKDRRSALSSDELLNACKVAGMRLSPAARVDIAESMKVVGNAMRQAADAIDNGVDAILNEHTATFDEVREKLYTCEPAGALFKRFLSNWGLD